MRSTRPEYAVTAYAEAKKHDLENGLPLSELDECLRHDWHAQARHFRGWSYRAWRHAVLLALGEKTQRAAHRTALRRRRKTSDADVILRARVARHVRGTS
jgi:hypothetical protein